VPTSHERKQLHESDYNSHGSELVPLSTTFHIDTETSRLLIANLFR